MAGILAISGLHCEAPPGATAHPALRLLRTAPRKARTTCANTRELMNKLPGNRQFHAPEGWRGASAYPGVELAFTDANGKH